MKRPIVISLLVLLLIVVFPSVTVQARIKKTTVKNVIHYELDKIQLQGIEVQDFQSLLHFAPYEQKDCKVKLKAQSQLINEQYHICLVLNLENPKYDLGSGYIKLKKTSTGKHDYYTLFPVLAHYNVDPLMQWVGTEENAWGIKYPSTWQSTCYEGESKYEFRFLLTLADFEDLVAGEELELLIFLNHSTLYYQIKNLSELRELKQKVMAVAKQPVPTNNAPAYSLEIFNSAEQLFRLLAQNIYTPELAGLLAKLGRKDVIYLENFRSYYYKEKGISFTIANTGEIVNIGLHNTNIPDEYQPYQGELPGGVTFADERRAAEAKLGPPSGFQPEKPGRFYAGYQGFMINYSNLYIKDGELTEHGDYAISSVILSLNTPAPAQILAPVDTQEYISLLGQSIKEPKTQSFLKGLGPGKVSSGGKYTYYFYPQRDAYLKVDTATSVIHTLWFRPKALGFQPYRGNFEGEIWLLDTRRSVEEKLGEPTDWGNSDSGAFWAKYRTGAKIHYQYLSASNRYNPVTAIEFSLEDETPAQPGAYLLNLLGKKSDSPEVGAFLGSLYNYSVLEHSQVTVLFTNLALGVSSGLNGIELTFTGREAPQISGITLRRHYFTGSLPGGITFNHERESIWGKLGKPVDSFGSENPVDDFLIGTKFHLSVVYYTPKDSPGKLFPDRINIYQVKDE
ncbi:MAG TPA: hypothetical protein GXZ26_02315 [Firmicutes bacterium]|nr:hypothetical protein [Bacillota bacterium]